MRAASIRGLIIRGVVVAAIASLAGCALPKPETLISPTPRPDSLGKYPCPYTADGKLAPWADRALNAKRGGARAGAMAAGMAIGVIPIAGDLFSEKVEQDMVKSNALKFAGGRRFMRESSDQSFNKLDDLAVWHYVNHSTVPEFKRVQKFLVELYPYLADNYGNAVRHAKRKPKPDAAPSPTTTT